MECVFVCAHHQSAELRFSAGHVKIAVFVVIYSPYIVRHWRRSFATANALFNVTARGGADGRSL